MRDQRSSPAKRPRRPKVRVIRLRAAPSPRTVSASVPARRYPENHRLRWERLERGWSYDEVAKRIGHIMFVSDGERVGLSGDSVRRWEAGERWPEPRYRRPLVDLFGKPASALGLLTSEELLSQPVATEEDQSTGSLIMNRGTLLRGLVGTGLAGTLVPLFGATEDAIGTVATVLRRGARPGREEANAFAEIVRHQRRLYWTAEAPLLFEAAVAQTQMGIRLAQTAVEEVRQQFMPAVAHSALLAGRLAFFDLRQAALAERCLQVARSAVHEADDHALAVGVLAHSSFIPGFAGDRAAAEVLLDGARGHLRQVGGPMLRSWVHCVASEVATLGGDPLAGVEHARQAEDSLATSGEDPDWLDFFNPARLMSFRGYAEMRAGRPQAIDTLKAALLGLSEEAPRQRTIVLLDLAAACASQDAAHALDLATEAIRILAEAPYATAFGRFPLLMERLPGQSYQSELTSRLRDNEMNWF